MKNKVLCIGDSLPLPREGVQYEETWFSLLQNNFSQFEFIEKFQRELTSDDIINIIKEAEYYNPSIIIFQTGICDCSPRIINKKKLFWKCVLELVSIIGIEGKFWSILKRIKNRNKNCVYVPLNRFNKNFRLIINTLRRINKLNKIIFIKIAIPSEDCQKKSPKILSNIQKYNLCIDEIITENKDLCVAVTPLNEGSKEDYVEDGYNLNKKGMMAVFQSIETYFRCYNEEY